MFELCAKIFGFVLNFIYGYVHNYGIAIIIFTIILKLCLMPMNIKQQKTMKKNAVLQQKVKEIQDKYASDPTRMNQEVIDLYKRENMSPFSGCLSSIFQFIVILSMFYLVSRPLTFMLNIDQNIINDYKTKVEQAEENTNLRYPEIKIIKHFAEKDENIYINMDFLGLDLSDVPSQSLENWKVYIIPVLYVITSFISMRLTTQLNSVNNQKSKENKKDDASSDDKDNENDTAEMMQQMTKNMNIMMPFMTVSIALIAPLGLALYWFLSNLLSIFERVVIYKIFEKEED